MSDHEQLRAPDEQTATPVPPPRHVACPRCRGTFEGDPDYCPHCGLAKADIVPPASQAGSVPTAVPEAAVTPPAVTPPVVPPPPPALPPDSAPAASAPETGGTSQRRKPLRLLVAGAVLLLVAGGVGWWVTTGGVKEDPCAKFRVEMQQVEARDHANSREERRAVAEVDGRARDAGCDLTDPAEGGEATRR